MAVNVARQIITDYIPIVMMPEYHIAIHVIRQLNIWRARCYEYHAHGYDKRFHLFSFCLLCCFLFVRLWIGLFLFGIFRARLLSRLCMHQKSFHQPMQIYKFLSLKSPPCFYKKIPAVAGIFAFILNQILLIHRIKEI